MSFRDKCLTINLDYAWMPAKEKKNYYDKESIHEIFGEDADERMAEETQGQGALKTPQAVSNEVLDHYLDGPEIDDPFV